MPSQNGSPPVRRIGDLESQRDDGGERSRILADVLQAASHLQLYVQICSAPREHGEWLTATALVKPDVDPLASLLQRLNSTGSGFNRRAAAASLMLRYGWAAGFAITSYLVQSRVPFLRDYALCFSSHSLLKQLWVREAEFVGLAGDPLAGESEWRGSVPAERLLGKLLESLIAFTEPVVAAHHAWSRFSRHALWAMVTSSWASQFANVARQLGDEGRGVRDARALFKQHPEISRAAPELYSISSGEVTRTCQKMRGCCLYYKTSHRRFCASCPIIPEAERLERNRVWVASQ